MPTFKKDKSKFQMKNMAYYKSKHAESENNSPYKSVFKGMYDQSTGDLSHEDKLLIDSAAYQAKQRGENPDEAATSTRDSIIKQSNIRSDDYEDVGTGAEYKKVAHAAPKGSEGTTYLGTDYGDDPLDVRFTKEVIKKRGGSNVAKGID